MHKTLIASLVVVLSACGTVGTVGTNYSAEGTWEGVVVNKANRYDSGNVKFILRDENGRLTGSHWYYDGYWKYLGILSGQRAGKSATWTITAPGGSIEIDGTFDGNSFKGNYYIYLKSGFSLFADLSLTRTSVQSLSQGSTESAKNLSTNLSKNLSNLFNLLR